MCYLANIEDCKPLISPLIGQKRAEFVIPKYVVVPSCDKIILHPMDSWETAVPLIPQNGPLASDRHTYASVQSYGLPYL